MATEMVATPLQIMMALHFYHVADEWHPVSTVATETLMYMLRIGLIKPTQLHRDVAVSSRYNGVPYRKTKHLDDYVERLCAVAPIDEMKRLSALLESASISCNGDYDEACRELLSRRDELLQILGVHS